MRDPYDPWADERTQAQPDFADIAETEAIRTCTHCDHQGIRPNGLTCCHIDHAAAAKRGLATIRAQMGWNTTTGTTHPRNPLKTAPRGSQAPKTTHVIHPHTPKTHTTQPPNPNHHQHPQPRKSTPCRQS